MGCLNPAEIELLLHGDSTDTTVRAFRDHVEHCPTCQACVKEAEANEELFGEMKGIFPNGILPSSGNEPPSGSSKDVVPFLTGKNTDAAHVDITAGYVLNGQYEIVEEVGRGLAVVYRAELLGRDIALKIIPAEPSTGADPLEQLVQEWERQNGINSEQVVRAYPPQRARYEGLPLLVLPMEYAPEGSFRRWLNDHYGAREDRLSTGL